MLRVAQGDHLRYRSGTVARVSVGICPEPAALEVDDDVFVASFKCLDIRAKT